MCFSDGGEKVFLDNDDGNAHEDLFFGAFGQFDPDSQSWKQFDSKLNGEEKGLFIIVQKCFSSTFFFSL